MEVNGKTPEDRTGLYLPELWSGRCRG